MRLGITAAILLALTAGACGQSEGFDGEELSLSIQVFVIDEEAGGFSSSRTVEDVQSIFEQANGIWAAAGVALGPVTVVRLAVPGRLSQELAEGNIEVFVDGLRSQLQTAPHADILAFYARSIGGPNGLAAPASMMFVIDQPTVDDERVTAHEIGHLLGLGHVSDRSQLMASGTNGIRLTDDEIDLARRRAMELVDR